MFPWILENAKVTSMELSTQLGDHFENSEIISFRGDILYASHIYILIHFKRLGDEENVLKFL